MRKKEEKEKEKEKQREEKAGGDFGDPQTEPVEVPIEKSFDLHPFAAKERLEMLDGYLEAALERGFEDVRVIHGRGAGVARAEVRAFLENDPRVDQLSEAPAELGGWGATLVRLAHPMAAARVAGQPVFIGDIQGCAVEFEEMLARVGRAFGEDFQLHVAGDAINRGHDNLRVLESIRTRVDAGLGEMVLGNHELQMLRVALELIETDESDTFHDILESDERDDWIAWLLSRPLARHGRVGRSTWVMVHASVHPDWSWDRVIREARRVEKHLGSGDGDLVSALLAPSHDPPRRGSRRDVLGRLSCARTVWGARSRWSSRQPTYPDDEPWHVVWRRRGHDYGVVYGHWATQGLNVSAGLRGLDTGCIHHGRRKVGYLAAWVPRSSADLERSAFDLPDPDIWQVRSRYRRHRRPSRSMGASSR